MKLAEGIEQLKGDTLVDFLATYEYAAPAQVAKPSADGDLGSWYRDVEDSVPGGGESWDFVTNRWMAGKIDDDAYLAALKRRGAVVESAAPSEEATA